ncbi:predicted protein [Phaeodactylum tricornutum CCAP 1055/1]|uniref:Kri1-like C-terminal domain-containing protein n=1 Tax=Phaeodactylum tricornutum (strain CCAP 1055/1) TaxID=556484 RepID=B7FUH6_PHATC|nr:predicted protein [Phaeodactylum tricornutum CCAP 1055/1]EEC49987.1 predicted protein [Phaeodactylum tricornutum CCAP 1055/1]|eukprot:XP_002178322.1 predicted protein [Phaeodactylum tricornutum CCAP 1055/1]
MAAQPAVSQGSTLFDSDNEDGRVFKVNTKYAKEYESRKQKEELRRVQFQGDDDDGESTDSSEDEDAELLTAKLDTNIIKTINILRSKDSRIYDPSVNFFDNAEDSEEDSLPTKESKSKPKRYKDVVREQILKQMDEDVPIGEENDNDYGVLASDEAKSRLAYDNRQQELRKAFVDSTTGKKGYGIDDDGEDSDDDSDTFLVVKKVSKGITEDEDTAEARQEFLQEMEKLEKTARDDNRDFVDPKGEVKDGERFLLDFFKRRNWLERDNGDSGPDGNSIKGIQPPRPIAGDGNESENSLEQLHKTDDFEAQYNFRFEEAAAKSQSGADFSIIGYARGQTMNTLRRKDESRRDKRLSRKDRKVADRTAKEEQLKRLKNAKRQEMEGKLKQVKSVLGEVENRGEAVDEAAILKLLEGDFDPEEFEVLMEKTYGEDFYGKEDSEWQNDKDVRESLKHDEDGDLLVGEGDSDGGLYDNVEEDTESYKDGHETPADENDEEGWPEEEEVREEIEETELERTVKLKVENELYKLDYEDIVADIPTRFKYRQVEANNFGLSTEEILLARDTTLKQFVSLKKLAPYNEAGEHFVGSRKRRRFRDLLKQELEETVKSSKAVAEEGADEPAMEDRTQTKKRRRLKKGKKAENVPGDATGTANSDILERSEETDEGPKTKRRRRKKLKKEELTDGNLEKTEKKTNKHSIKARLESEAQEENKVDKRNHHTKKPRHKKKKSGIEGVSHSRLESYGL